MPTRTVTELAHALYAAFSAADRPTMEAPLNGGRLSVPSRGSRIAACNPPSPL
jgi:hypothetical protein